MPVTAPALKATSRPSPSDFVAACAVRTLARTETFMPMKPAAPDRTAPIRKPIATICPEKPEERDEEHDADDGDRQILALEIGLRAFGDRAGDLLHARGAGVALHDVGVGPDAVGDRQSAKDDDQQQGGHEVYSAPGGARANPGGPANDRRGDPAERRF